MWNWHPYNLIRGYCIGLITAVIVALLFNEQADINLYKFLLSGFIGSFVATFFK